MTTTYIDNYKRLHSIVDPLVDEMKRTKNLSNVKVYAYFKSYIAENNIPKEVITKEKIRLFYHDFYGLCTYNKGKRRYGTPLTSNDKFLKNLFKIEIIKSNKNKKSSLEKYCDNIRKFKKAFTEECHPYLWQEIQEAYKKFDVEEFYIKALNEIGAEGEKVENGYGLAFYDFLNKFCREKNISGIITENHYGRTTLRSNVKRNKYGFGTDIEKIISNVKDAIENKKDYSTHWRANYDVSLQVKKSEDGNMRAWLSLEYKNCGNGHYYLLINENLAIFCEND